MQRQPPNFAVERHSMTTPTELGPAGKLIAKGWTQRALARDANGAAVAPEFSDAVCWCPSGAIRAVYPNHHDKEKAKAKLREAIGDTSIPFWNDDPSRTKEQAEEAMMKAGV